ncbi:MAG: glycosyl hydrolase family 28 protein [Planctomycetia bacterium]|nr:glycosyl hydrolase family 28 protein [Planctomycetia bacterium]
MTEPEDQLSRRNWLVRLSTASFGTAMLAMGSGAAAEPAQPPAAGNTLGARTYNIRDFGAKGDGKTVDTVAVQAAIDACHSDGGGIVLAPAGVFVIGTVQMKSNVTLRIAAGGKLLGSADGKQYHAASSIPPLTPRFERCGNVGLIYAVRAENITIEGPGTIDGQGAEFRSPRGGGPPPSGRSGDHRPYHLLFYRCNNIRLRDIFLRNSAYHSVRIIESSFIWAYSLRIYNRVNYNNDGFHFVSCRYVHVSDCDVQSEDDACAMFGSCRFVTIANSTFSTRWAVFRFGGGNPENIAISNCLIYKTYGCPIKMHFGPQSRAQNILFCNLILQDVTGPISIDLDDRPRPGEKSREKGYVRNIMFNGLRCRVLARERQLPDIPFRHQDRPGENRQCIVLNCIGDGFLEDISFNDVRIAYGGGGTNQEARRRVPRIAGEYFEIGTPPAYGLYARQVRGLSLCNVRFEVIKPDLRPAMVLDRVRDAGINALSVQGNPEAMAALRFIQSGDVLLSATRLVSPAAVFLRVEGAVSGGIVVDGGDISRAAAPLALQDGAEEKAVKLRI